MSRLLQEKAEIEARLLADNPDAAAFLYHGSSVPERLSTLRPSFSQTMHHRMQGDFVFASNSFLNAALYTLKMPQKNPDDRNFGFQRVGEFLAGDATPYPGKSTLYAMVGDYDRLEREYKGGYIYGIHSQDFEDVDEYGGEQVSQKEVSTEFAVKVDSPRDIMEAGVQIFGINGDWAADDIAYNWRYVVEAGQEQLALRSHLLPSGMITWINKEKGIEIPFGPMCDWD